MRRLTSILTILCMIAVCATASANIMPNEQIPCGDDDCGGGTIHACHCTVLDRCPCIAVDAHGIVNYGIPVAPIDTPEEDNHGYWETLMRWFTEIAE